MNQELSTHSPELRELSSTDLKFLEEGLDGGTSSLCDLDTIFDDFHPDTHIQAVLLNNPDQLLNGNISNNVTNDILCHWLYTLTINHYYYTIISGYALIYNVYINQEVNKI